MDTNHEPFLKLLIGEIDDKLFNLFGMVQVINFVDSGKVERCAAATTVLFFHCSCFRLSAQLLQDEKQ